MGRIELNCVPILNWIVWNGTIFDIKTVYLCETELFEIELFICIKMVDVPSNQTKPNQIIIPNKRLNNPIWLADGTLTGTNIPGYSGLESNDNGGMLHIPQTPRLRTHHQM